MARIAPPRIKSLQDDVAEQLAQLDVPKRMIAVAVQHALLTGEDCPPLMGPTRQVTRQVGVAVSAVITEVWLRTPEGWRAFLVKVSETSTEGRTPPGNRKDS